EELRRLQTVGREKIRLLEVERDRAENDRRDKEKETKIARLEATLAERDKAGAELQELVGKAEAAFRRLIELSASVAPAWAWNAPDFAAGLLTGQALQGALSTELFRVGAKPRLLGGREEKFEPDFPGGRCPDHRLLGLPKQLPSLASQLAEASRYLSDMMHGRRTNAGPVASPAQATNGNGIRTEPPPTGEKAALLVRLNELSPDTTEAGEAEYQKASAQLAALS